MNRNEWFSNHYDPLKNNVCIYTCIYDQGFPVLLVDESNFMRRMWSKNSGRIPICLGLFF